MTRRTLLFSLPAQVLAQSPGPPHSPAEPVSESLHGVRISDPYHWLEDQDSPATRNWIDTQNRYSRPILAALPSRPSIIRRISELRRVDFSDLPTVRNGRYFAMRRSPTQEQFVISYRQGPDSPDQLLVDPHSLSPDKTTSVRLLDVSPEGSLIAFGLRQGGEDESIIKLLAVDTRRELADVLPRANYLSLAILPGNRGFYYSRLDDGGPRVLFHALGAPSSSDRVLFGEGYGAECLAGVALSSDGRWLVVSLYHGSAGDRVDVWVQDTTSDGPLRPVVQGISSRFEALVGAADLYLHTNWKAPNGRVLRVSIADPARERWREIIPESADTIESVSLAAGCVCVRYLHDAASRLAVFSADGKHIRDLPPPALGTITSLYGQWEDPEAFYAFSSFRIPTSIFRCQVKVGTQHLWWHSGARVDSSSMELSQVWCTSRDGTRVPMFLLHRKGFRPDGTARALLTGYGGFALSPSPFFSAEAVVWVERGGVFAFPSLRGGGEFGESWHQAGMLANKQNVFDDFFAAAEWLIKNRYTRASRLAATGGSNGGLLVGAALTQRPDLFGAVSCIHPLLDMLRYHKFLLGKAWVSEYGSADDPAQFRWLYAYSPYHRVRKGTAYPAVIFITGDSDTRVAPLHARKMTALLQASTSSSRPIILRYEAKAGHSGGQPVNQQIEVLADEISFLWDQTSR